MKRFLSRLIRRAIGLLIAAWCAHALDVDPEAWTLVGFGTMSTYGCIAMIVLGLALFLNPDMIEL